MIPCKNCHQNNTVKNVYVRHKQRYKCRSYDYNFVKGDAQHKLETEVKKALSIILYSLDKSSFGFLCKLFCVLQTTTYYWARQVAATIDELTIARDVQAIDFDEMWHFLQSKKENSGLSKPWIITQGEPLSGYSVVVMLQPSSACYDKVKQLRPVYFIPMTGEHLHRSYQKTDISLAKHIHMLLNAIIRIRGITSHV
jgi:hypothetical protein